MSMERRSLLRMLAAAPAAAVLALAGGSKPPKVPAVATGGCDEAHPGGEWTATSYTYGTSGYLAVMDEAHTYSGGPLSASGGNFIWTAA